MWLDLRLHLPRYHQVMMNLAPIHDSQQAILRQRLRRGAIRLSLRWANACTTSLYLIVGLSAPTLSQSGDPAIPVICDVNLNLLKSIDSDKNPQIVTADTVSAAGTTTPSLWWINEQFPAKLVTNWIANRDRQQIYLLVNTEYWSGLDYLDRYGTIDRFGRVAQSYGYNLTICNGQKIALARYNCDLLLEVNSTQNTSKPTTQNSCEIWLNANGQDGLGVQSK